MFRIGSPLSAAAGEVAAPRSNDLMVTDHVAAALRRARYQTVDDGLICATVPGLRGVIATAATVEGCRTELAEVIEAWLLVRVARVPVPGSEGARLCAGMTATRRLPTRPT